MLLVVDRYRLLITVAKVAVCCTFLGVLAGCDWKWAGWHDDVATRDAEDSELAQTIRDVGGLFGPAGTAIALAIVPVAIGARKVVRSISDAREQAKRDAADAQQRVDAAWDESSAHAEARASAAHAAAAAAFDEGAARAAPVANAGVSPVPLRVPGPLPAATTTTGAIA